MRGQGQGVVVITSGFPRRSETFALNELLALENSGLLAGIFATKPGDGLSPQPGSERLLHRLEVLAPGRPDEQAAAVTARLTGRIIRGIHAYFAHTPAEVASNVARRLGVPYSFSVHARDARKVDRDTLTTRIRRAAGVIACNTDVAQDLSFGGNRIRVVPHGVDLERFEPRPLPVRQPLRLLAVGRLVEKKGFDVLLAAVARLALPFRLQIVGEGPERERLAAAIAVGALGDRVTLCGGRTHADMPDLYANAHVVVVPSVADSSGDRDGLPNVVLEALASQRPVVASAIAAIPNAVIPEKTGILVPPRDVTALADALTSLASRPDLGERLGAEGRRWVEHAYDLRRCTDQFCRAIETIHA